MPAAAITVGTIVDVSGSRGVVAGFASNGRVIVAFDLQEHVFDALLVWSVPCPYNRQLAAGTGRHPVQP